MTKATCTEPGCVNPIKSRGLCTTHYFRARRAGELESLRQEDKWHILSDVSIERREAICSICGPTEIEVREHGGRVRRECVTARRSARRDSDRARTPEKLRVQYLNRFNVTEDWYAQTFAKQGGGCAICGNTEHGGHNWHIDHDHACCDGPSRSCGKCVRGILCHLCNAGLGCARDDQAILAKMIDYLQLNTVAT